MSLSYASLSSKLMDNRRERQESETALGSFPTTWSNLTPDETVPARRKADSHCLNQWTGSASQNAGRSTLETAAMSALAPSGIDSSAAAAASAAARLCRSISFSASSCACSVLASCAFNSVGEDMVAWEGVG